jgi:hypothetical protein
MLVRQRVETLTHVVELLSFMQDRTRRHRIRGFPENLRSENFRRADLVQDPKGGSAGCPEIELSP